MAKHIHLSPDDEFADYETRDIGNLDDPLGSDLFSATVGPVARKNSRAKPILEIDFIVGLLVNLSNGVAAAFHVGSEIAILGTARLEVVLAGLLLPPVPLGLLLMALLIRTSCATQTAPCWPRTIRQ